MRSSFIVIVFSLLALAAFAEPPPIEHTQLGRTEESAQRLTAAEMEMVTVLRELQRRAGDNQTAIAKLKSAQTAWEKYRAEQLEALWSAADRARYGSAYPMCVADAKRLITEARTRQLRAMLSPTEGDVCRSRWPE